MQKSDFFFEMQGLGSKLRLIYSQKEGLEKWTKGRQESTYFRRKWHEKYIIQSII